MAFITVACESVVLVAGPVELVLPLPSISVIDVTLDDVTAPDSWLEEEAFGGGDVEWRIHSGICATTIVQFKVSFVRRPVSSF